MPKGPGTYGSQVGRPKKKKGKRKGKSKINEQKLEEMIGESVWNTYRSMAYLIEAYNRAGRIRTVTQERGRRAEKHDKRTGQIPRSTSRLDIAGKPQSGKRKELRQYKR